MKTMHFRNSVCAAALLPLCLALVTGSHWPSLAQTHSDSGRHASRVRLSSCRPGSDQDEAKANRGPAQDDRTESGDADKPDNASEEVPSASTEQADPFSALRRKGLIPKSVKSNAALSEAELAELTRGVARQLAIPASSLAAVKQASAPVNRLRVLAVLVKLAVSADDIASYREALPEQMPPDSAMLPLWARTYAAAAVDRGWWDGDKALRPRENATWAFAAHLLHRLLPDESKKEERVASSAHLASAKPATKEDGEGSYSGLVIDARGMKVERQIGPRVLDEDGNVVYPDPKFLPEIDWLEDHGMADYETDPASTHRAGDHALTVKALKTAGVGHDDMVVSNEIAEQIRRAARHNVFLKKWAVCILMDPK